MKPSQVTNALRRIASGIEASKKPDKSLVAQALKKILAIMLNQGHNFGLDLLEAKNSFANAFDNLDWDAVAKEDDGSMLLTSEPADTLCTQYDIAITVHIVDNERLIAVSPPGDLNVVYRSDVGSFNPDVAAEKVVGSLQMMGKP